MTLKEHLYFKKMQIKKWFGRVTINDLHEHWRYPDKANKPEDYLKPLERSEFLYQQIKDFIPHHAKILELGCNVGRNLAYLRDKGYSNLTGIEINHNAIALGTQKGNFGYITVIESSIEDYFRPMRLGFDLIFTMAVLEYLHPKSDYIFRDMARASKYILTIEDEASKSFQHTPRNYKKIFEDLGMTQILEQDCGTIFPKKMMLRLFKK